MKYSDPRSTIVRRNAALARPELRGNSEFVDVAERLPDEGRECTVWAMDGEALRTREAYRIPFPVVRRGDGWHNAKRGNRIEVRVVGWIYKAP